MALSSTQAQSPGKEDFRPSEVNQPGKLFPQGNNKVDYLFVRQGTKEAEGFFNLRCQVLHDALTNHGIEHESYISGDDAHDRST